MFIRVLIFHHQLQILLRVLVADAFHHASDEVVIVGEFAVGHELADEVAEGAAEIFVAGET